MKNNSLSKSIRTVATFAVCTAPFWANSAFAGSMGITKMVTFGDSLSDIDNLAAITGGYPPAPFYEQGRFTNGKVWLEYLSEDMGINNTVSFYEEMMSQQKASSLAGVPDFSKSSINFAVGGARTDGHLDPTLNAAMGDKIGLLGQIESYQGLIQMGSTAVDDSTLYTIMAGSNDFLALAQGGNTDPNAVINNAVNNVLSSVVSLANMGAKKIAIANLSNIGDTPVGANAGQIDSLNQLTGIYNTILAQGIAALRVQYADISFIELDVNHLSDKILDNPEQYGLVSDAKKTSCTNITVPSIPDNFTKCSNPDEYFYYDDQHPDTKIHQKLADYVEDEIRIAVEPIGSTTPEPSAVGTLGLLGIGLLWQAKRKQK